MSCLQYRRTTACQCSFILSGGEGNRKIGKKKRNWRRSPASVQMARRPVAAWETADSWNKRKVSDSTDEHTTDSPVNRCRATDVEAGSAQLRIHPISSQNRCGTGPLPPRPRGTIARPWTRAATTSRQPPPPPPPSAHPPQTRRRRPSQASPKAPQTPLPNSSAPQNRRAHESCATPARPAGSETRHAARTAQKAGDHVAGALSVGRGSVAMRNRTRMGRQPCAKARSRRDPT